MSKTTSSPRPISRSPGSACGRAPLGPAATIAGKEGSAPSSRIRASAARATSRSVRPDEAALQAPAPDLVGELRGGLDRRQLAVVLDPAQLLDRAARPGPPRPRRPSFSSSRSSVRTDIWSSSKPTLPSRRSAMPASQSPLDGDRLPALDLGGGALGVAEVGEEEAHAGPADAGAVGAGEAGQVADVDQVGDQHPVELALGQERPRAGRRGRASGRRRRARGPSSSSASR